ncbi:DUF3891 family protein [Vacuolonema iberomarrocanum]|uniref:DUF3891 family protein n=1 Tax=Vacuolonema iberomarrocanum TaxID=3454632 RepID=UPI001A026860|nr:DUF3891 family protein [filamentous cyanobacterium LEGE 07170]
MIVNLQSSGWEIIYHRAHALLAAQIAGNWDTSECFYRPYEIIATISHHDDLERGWEDAQITEAGAPQDFTLDPLTVVEDLYDHIDGALHRGRWVALLTSMHLCFLMQSQKDDNHKVAEFLENQEKKQKQWREEMELNQENAKAAYNFMQWCDRLSLILCQRKIPDAGRALEITNGPEGESYWLRQLDSGNVTIDPWPFTADTFALSIDTCHLTQLQFESDEALREALKAAPRKITTWSLSRSND